MSDLLEGGAGDRAMHLSRNGLHSLVQLGLCVIPGFYSSLEKPTHLTHVQPGQIVNKN